MLDGTRESHDGFAPHFPGENVGNEKSKGHVADGWSRAAVKTRRHCAANFARRRCSRRQDVGPGELVLPCNTKTRKTAGYNVQCAFVSRARSRKDAVGILAGASVVILIVTERRVRFSCFLTCASRICITMFRHGRARVRANVCKLPSSLLLLAHSSSVTSSLFLGWGKRGYGYVKRETKTDSSWHVLFNNRIFCLRNGDVLVM